MINRRQFLVAGLAGFGAWVVGAGLAKRIARLARERHEPYLLEVESPSHTLWANDFGDRYVFTLDCPYVGIEYPN